MTINLSQEDQKEIKQLHHNCKQRKHADKLKAILMLNEIQSKNALIFIFVTNKIGVCIVNCINYLKSID